MGKSKTAIKSDYGTSPKKSFFTRLAEQKELFFITLPFLLLLLLFNYVPLWGWIMAFQNFQPFKGVWHSDFVGIKNFITIFKEAEFYRAIRNTLGISILKYITGFLATITLAVLMNEIRVKGFKKLVQSISYLPHFVSWVVAAGIVYSVLSPDTGVVNNVLVSLHIIGSPINFMGKQSLFWWIVAFADIWKEVGWGTIIYLAAMTAIDGELYEAAHIDGAGRIRRIFAITLPGIIPIIKIMMILSAGYLLSSNFEQIYLLQNSTLLDVSRTLELYVYQYGIGLGRFSFATAAGIFTSLVAVILVTFFNKLSSILDGRRAF